MKFSVNVIVVFMTFFVHIKVVIVKCVNVFEAVPLS